MKNTYTSASNKTNDQGYKPVKTVIALLGLFLIFSTSVVRAQEKHVGISATTGFSGSGLGLFYSPAVYIQKNRVNFSVGAVINANSPNSIGAQTGLDYSLKEQKKLNLKNIHSYEDYNSRAELFLFTTLLYRPYCKLSDPSIAAEAGQTGPGPDQARNMQPQLQPEKMKFTTYEGYAGFGLKIKINNRIKWSSRIGGGAYYSPDAPTGMFRTQVGVSLLVRTGFYIGLF